MKRRGWTWALCLCALGAAEAAWGQCSNYFLQQGSGTVNPGVNDIGNHGDDQTVPVFLPFDFTFYGQTYNTLNVCSNGWASFTATNTGYSNGCLPQMGAPAFNSVPGATLYVHWDDQRTDLTAPGIFSSESGTAPNRVFSLEWRTVYYAQNTVHLNYQLNLHENGTIEYVYGTIPNAGVSATIGIQDGNGVFVQHTCNTTSSLDGTKLTFYCPTSPPPIGVGSASPASAPADSSVLLTVATTPGSNPPSTGITVTGDLTSIGGPSSQAFFDDGSNGDVTAGDGTFSYLAAVGPLVTPGQAPIGFTVADAETRSSTGIISLTVTAARTGICCTAGACSVVTRYNCTQGGGSYNGDGSICGLPTYEIVTSPEAFSSIISFGTMATVASACDDCTENVALPFPFQFYENVYNDLFISSNGNLQFGATASASFFNDAIPTAATPNNAIYPMWDDLNPLQQGDVYYAVTGEVGSRKFIVEWNGVTQYTAVNTYPLTNETFQVVLHEGTNNIDFRYETISASNTSGTGQGTGIGPGGDDYTVGIEAAGGVAAAWIPGTDLGTGNTSRRVVFTAAGNPCGPVCATSDYDGDGDSATDADIEAFFACLAGNCCATCWHLGADIDADGDSATDADIEAFFRILAGNAC